MPHETLFKSFPENPSRPNTHGYAGSEDFIRLQFEEYLLALLSSVKYQQYVQKHGNDPKALLSETCRSASLLQSD